MLVGFILIVVITYLISRRRLKAKKEKTFSATLAYLLSEKRVNTKKTNELQVIKNTQDCLVLSSQKHEVQLELKNNELNFENFTIFLKKCIETDEMSIFNTAILKKYTLVNLKIEELNEYFRSRDFSNIKQFKNKFILEKRTEMEKRLEMKLSSILNDCKNILLAKKIDIDKRLIFLRREFRRDITAFFDNEMRRFDLDLEIYKSNISDNFKSKKHEIIVLKRR